MKHTKWMLSVLFVTVLSCFVSAGVYASAAAAEDAKSLRIIATSDLHGKIMPWDYALNEESSSGSMAQLSSAITQFRNENTLLVDGGDTIQDNAAVQQ